MPLDSPGTKTAYHPALAWFCAIGGFWVFVLVTLGAFTTSIGAGMAFPDWPLSNGSLNPDGWLSNLAMFAEHSHRLSAGVMTIITLTAAIWIWSVETRTWLRRLAWAAVGLIVVQALLGGLRVLLENQVIASLETTEGRLFAMAHACLAQIFVCTMAGLAAACSRRWIESPVAPEDDGRDLRRAARGLCTVLLLQLAVAAVMRHSSAGLSISTFPRSTVSGSWLPEHWDFRVGIHFAHRCVAGLVAVAAVAFGTAVWRHANPARPLKLASIFIVFVVAAQIYLGASVIWSGRNPSVTTGHVFLGALLLSSSFLVAWWLHRPLIESRRPSVVKEVVVEESAEAAQP